MLCFSGRGGLSNDVTPRWMECVSAYTIHVASLGRKWTTESLEGLIKELELGCLLVKKIYSKKVEVLKRKVKENLFIVSFKTRLLGLVNAFFFFF